MNPWRNPFAVNPQNSARHEEHSKHEEEFSDDDEFGERVVYNHGPLKNLFGLYQRGKQDVNQILASSETTEGQRHLNSDCHLSVEQEKSGWTSLEKLRSFSFGGTQIPVHKDQSENHVLEVPIESNFGLHQNDDQFRLSSDPEASLLGAREHFSSDDDKLVEEHEACTWSDILREAEELDDNGQTSVIERSSLTGNCAKTRLQKGASAKRRFKFSIHPGKQSFYAKGSKPLNNCDLNISSVQHFELFAGPEVPDRNSRPLPMVERIQELFEKNNSSCPSNKSRGTKRKETRAVNSGKRTLCSFYGRCSIANEDILNTHDSDEASVDDRNSGLGLKSNFPMGKGHSLTDLFQEALSAAPQNESNASLINRPNGPVFGFSDRLQRVLQHEKHQHMQFMKILHTGQKLQDTKECMNAQILEKRFEAKLTICKCTVEKAFQNTERIQNSLEAVENKGCLRTVIFSSRTSGNLEIEVGNVVRIHPPWKEVQRREEKIIVCTYFCEMVPLCK